MGRACCLCKATTKDKALSFHRFPTNTYMRNQWISNLNLKNSTLTKYSVVCSKHFAPNCFIESRSRKVLRKNIIPHQETLPSTVSSEETLTASDETVTAGTSEDDKENEQPYNVKTKYAFKSLEYTQKPHLFLNLGSSSSSLENLMQTSNDVKRTNSSNLKKPLVCSSSQEIFASPVSFEETLTVSAASQETVAFTTFDNDKENEQPDNVETKCALENLEVSKAHCSYTLQEVSFSSIDNVTQKTRKRKRRYIGDYSSSDFNSPKRAKYCWNLAIDQIRKQKLKLNTLRQSNLRLQDKVVNLTSLLRKQLLLSENAENVMKATLPGSSNEKLVQQILQPKRKIKYSTELRRFAITLSFYSQKAYNYVRNTFNKSLPHPSTITKWFRSIDGMPGFCEEALNALNIKCQEARLKNKTIVCNLVVDEMSIRKQIEWAGKRYTGFVDLGTNLEHSDDLEEAEEVWVYMLVPLNDHWKIPFAYFFLSGLNGSERAYIILKGFEFLSTTDIEVASLTFDGAPVNLYMVSNLGANLTSVDNLKVDFKNPSNDYDIFIMPDACHMLKLIRNCLGSQKIIIAGNNREIRWEYFDKLVDIQEKEGLHLANKLKKKHLQWFTEKMKVKVAAQTFSESVSDALFFLCCKLKIPEFEGAEETIEFCRIINNTFDILNTRNFLSKSKYKLPLNKLNCKEIFQYLDYAVNYIKELKTSSNQRLIYTARKMGFMGFVIACDTIKKLYYKYIDNESPLLKFLLTYKLSQDHLELFFSAVRSQGGHNNNPSAKQFESAFKKLLVHAEIKESASANIMALDETSILHVSSSNTISMTNMGINLSEHDTFFTPNEDDHDYIMPKSWELSLYSKNIIYYISGFVLKTLSKHIACEVCLQALSGSSEVYAEFESIKSRGYLRQASHMLFKICELTEKNIRYFKSEGKLFTKFVEQRIALKVMSEISSDLFNPLLNHILDDSDILNNHITQLTKLIIMNYLKVRINYEARLRTDKCISSRVRSELTKTILFKNQ